MRGAQTMEPPRAIWHTDEVRAAVESGDLGAIVRSVRHAHHLTLADLARRCGYSVSTLSRMERGKQPLGDVRVLRSLAKALRIPPALLGLADTPRRSVRAATPVARVGVILMPGEGTDSVRRRTLLTGLTSLAGTAMLGTSPQGLAVGDPVANHRFTAFGPTGVGLYRISIARVLGDFGTAVEAARRIDPAAIPLVERRARYWSDLARSFHQWGKPEQCYRALLAAEHASADEVRYRKPIQQITTNLLRHPTARALPGLRAFATRTGTHA
ncbi:helix-turn-helix domain-containing protein [Saccharothrix hoggarensis]|uniref:Helix-turn-helix domain-containing protein n=1 Tax=Saccharothrix hoggarensis TaxID=913853 RepID=A0ABW3QFU1_9PSEU